MPPTLGGASLAIDALHYFRASYRDLLVVNDNLGEVMVLGKCRECQHDVSKTAKTCPNCGVARPHRQTWSDLPLLDKVFVTIILLPIGLMIFTSYIKKENNLYKRVSSIDESNYQEKYKGYLKLHEIDGTNNEYIEKTIHYGKLFLKSIPVTEPEQNLEIYQALANLEPSENYSGKIALYSFMSDVSTDCAVSAQNMSLKSLNNQSTYESNYLGSGGRWLDKDTYGYVHSFEGKNSFGIASQFAAHYVCNVDSNSRKFTVRRVSINRK